MSFRTPVMIGGCLALAGCGLLSSSALDDSASGRCAAFMQKAMPNTKIEITATKAAGDQTSDLDTIRATAEGSAQGERPGPVAMECVFHDDILVSIRWLAGPEAAK
jgi:hypothetical protein